MSSIIEAVASVPPLRRAGSFVTSRLKRWSVDVAISGFPKCGNTWYGAMLRQVIVDRFGVTGVPLSRLFVSDLGPLPLPLLRLPAGIPRVYHGHFMPFPDRTDLTGIRESLAPFDDKPMIVLIRDCKDVLVSYYMMEVKLFGRADAARDIAEFVLGSAYGVQKFVGYYNVIAESRRGGKAPTLVTSYEALWHDPAAIIERDAAFIGAGGLAHEAFARIAQQYSFANMRRMELAATAETAIVPGLHRIADAPPDAAFVRRGGSGNWREHLTPQIAAQIDDYVAAHIDPLFRAEALRDAAAQAVPS
jgi:hypothetical protein